MGSMTDMNSDMHESSALLELAQYIFKGIVHPSFIDSYVWSTTHDVRKNVYCATN